MINKPDTIEVNEVGDLAQVLAEFVTLKTQIPILINDAVTSHNFVNKADVQILIRAELTPYSTTETINATIGNGFDEFNKNFNYFVTEFTDRSLAQQATIDQHAKDIARNTTGDDRQQTEISQLKAILPDIVLIKKSIVGDGLQTGLVGRMEADEHLIKELAKNIDATNVAIMQIKDDLATAKRETANQQLWQQNYDNRQQALKQNQQAEAERIKLRNIRIWESLRFILKGAGLGSGVVTAIGGLFEMAGR